MATTFQYKVRSLKTDPNDDNYITEATVEVFGTEGSVTKSSSAHCVFPGNKTVVGSGFKSKGSRSKESIRLLTYGLTNFDLVQISKAKEPFHKINVWLGKEDFVETYTNEDIYKTIKKFSLIRKGHICILISNNEDFKGLIFLIPSSKKSI